MSKSSLTSFDDIFNDTSERENVQTNNKPAEIPIARLQKHPKKRFGWYKGERLNDMIDSVRKNGILQPILVRSIVGTDDYVILAGHNRTNAAKLAGLSTVPAYVIENLSDAAANIYFYETNLLQSSFDDLTHTERAEVLAEYHSELFSQGKRNDIICELEELAKLDGTRADGTSSQIGTKLRSDEKIAKEYGLSRSAVARYLRIDKLVEELKPLIDNGSIPFMAGVNISYLSDIDQKALFGYLTELKGIKLDLVKSKALKEYAQKSKLTTETMLDILTGKNKTKKTLKAKEVKIKGSVLKRYFAEDMSKNDIEETIEKALALYFSQEGELQ